MNRIFQSAFSRLNNLTVRLLFLNSFWGIFLGKLIQFFSRNQYRILPIDFLTHLEGRKTIQPAYEGYVYSPAEINRPSEPIKKHYAALGYNLISNGLVHNTSPFVLKGSKLYRQLYDAGTPNKGIDFKISLILQTTGQSAYIKAQPIKNYEKGIFIGGSWNLNWYHWLIEILPKTELIQYLPEEAKEYPLLVPKEIQQKKNQFFLLKALFPERELIFIEQFGWSKVKKLVWIDSPNIMVPSSKLKYCNNAGEEKDYNFDAKFSMGFRDRIFQTLKIDQKEQGLPKRIFLARNQKKRAYNQDGLLAMLQQYGFVPVYLEQLTVKEQVTLLHQVEFIIGPTGSAWANLLFCKENAQGILFGPEVIRSISNYANFWMLNHFNLIHYFFPCKSASWKEYMHSDEAIDLNIAELESIVLKMLEKK